MSAFGGKADIGQTGLGLSSDCNSIVRLNLVH